MEFPNLKLTANKGVPPTQKSVIYRIDCKDCNKTYIGQTKRSIETRFKEHLAHLKYGRTEKSAVAEHALDNSHTVGSVKLLKSVHKINKLDPLESIFISKFHQISINHDKGPICNSALIDSFQISKQHNNTGHTQQLMTALPAVATRHKNSINQTTLHTFFSSKRTH